MSTILTVATRVTICDSQTVTDQKLPVTFAKIHCDHVNVWSGTVIHTHAAPSTIYRIETTVAVKSTYGANWSDHTLL